MGRKACQGSDDTATSARDAAKVQIRKMLDMAFHPRTAEAKGAQALRNAERLMRTHALAEEKIRQATESPESGLFAANMCPKFSMYVFSCQKCWKRKDGTMNIMCVTCSG